MVATVGRGKLAIDVDDYAGLVGAGAGFIRRKDARGCGGDGQSSLFGEEAEGDSEGGRLRVESRGFAIEGVDKQATEGGGGEGEEVAAGTGHG